MGISAKNYSSGDILVCRLKKDDFENFSIFD